MRACLPILRLGMALVALTEHHNPPGDQIDAVNVNVRPAALPAPQTYFVSDRHVSASWRVEILPTD